MKELTVEKVEEKGVEMKEQMIEGKEEEKEEEAAEVEEVAAKAAGRNKQLAFVLT